MADCTRKAKMTKKPDKPMDEETGRAMAINESDYSGENKSLLVRLAESELESLILTARKYPRNVNRARDSMYYMATIDEDTAGEMNYALPRGGKAIEGPSIRFAEVAVQSWGNCRTQARVIEVNRVEKYVEAEGGFIDLETNMAHVSRERRRIFDKEGRLYNDDQINLTGKAACAIAKRNAILTGIPQAAWREAYEASRKTASGSREALPRKRRETLEAFGRFGVGPDRLLASLGVRGEADITLDHIATLRGMWSALKSGEATTEEMFAPLQAQISEKSAKKKKATLDDLAESDDENTKNLDARNKEIADARDAGLMGYHKGLTKTPANLAKDPELDKAWIEGWIEAKEASGEDQEDELA